MSRLFTPRAVTPILTALVLVTIAVGWNSGTGTISATTTGTPVLRAGGSCPLTAAQQANSNKAWLKMMPVFRHPRCLNCHGGIPDPLASPVPAKHSGVVDMDSTDSQATCEECHMPGWRIPGHKWTQKGDLEICSDMKVLFNPTQFIDHIVRDGGGTPFIEMAFEGKRGLNDGAGRSAVEDDLKRPFVAEPPPGTHAQLVQQARAWVAAQGGQFVGDPSCGCVLPGSKAYEVTVKFAVTQMSVMSDFAVDYSDNASFVVNTFPNRDSVHVSALVNQNGQVAGLTERNAHCKHAVVDQGNLLDIKNVSGTFGHGPGTPDRLWLVIRSSSTSLAYTTNCGSTTRTTTGYSNDLSYTAPMVLDSPTKTFTLTESVYGAVVTVTVRPRTP